MKEKETQVLTDEQLIAQTLSGNDNAFKMLVQRHESRIAATVIGMLGNRPEAEDVGQEVFIRFYKNLKNFRGDSAVSTYLTRIAINLSLNEIRRRKLRSLFSSIDDDEKTLELPDESAKKPDDDSSALVHRAIRKLDTKYRTVIVLRLLEGYSTEETAEILEIPQGTVMTRLLRAQQKLKTILSPYFAEAK